MKQRVLNNLKNIYGWKTKRKIVVISVDDYGNVRLDSKKAREVMDGAGLKVNNRYDAYDTLETREDLETLYEALSSVKDKNGRHAVFTPFALPCNIDFEQMHEDGYLGYRSEHLPVTYEKLSLKDPIAYQGAWELWKEGIDTKIMIPQFHGREHFNLKVFNEKLENKDKEMLVALKNRSYTSISNSGYKTIKYTAAFDFWKYEENYNFDEIIKEGLDAFEEVFGYKAIHFNPPGATEHHYIHESLHNNEIRYLDTALLKNEHLGEGKYKKEFNYTGKKNGFGMIYHVRNVVFEPTDSKGFDWVAYSLKQIEAAFFWNRPAIISSHRVNFCGHIDPDNRKTGITTLKTLLKEIVRRWPDVEFMAANELGDLIAATQK